MAHDGRRGGFEVFYLRKVALNEGCGCAERIIDSRDLDARARAATLQRAAGKGQGPGLRARLRRLFRRGSAQR